MYVSRAEHENYTSIVKSMSDFANSPKIDPKPAAIPISPRNAPSFRNFAKSSSLVKPSKRGPVWTTNLIEKLYPWDVAAEVVL